MTKNTKKQNTKKTIQAKKENKQKTFLEYTQAGDSIKQALLKTRAIRKVFLNKNYIQNDLAPAINTLANKYGYSKAKYDMMASYPLKSDLAKIKTILPFENKTRDVLSPRMITALCIAFLNRDDDAGFSRIFPCGLFLENGCLTDLLTGGFIKSKAGENEKQVFSFCMDKIGGLFKSSEYLAIEKKAIDSGIV